MASRRHTHTFLQSTQHFHQRRHWGCFLRRLHQVIRLHAAFCMNRVVSEVSTTMFTSASPYTSEVYIGVVVRYTGFLFGTASPPGGFLRLTVASVASYAYIRAFLIRQFASAPPFGKPLTVTFIAFSRARRTVRNRKQLSTAYQCLQALGISPDHGVISSSLGHFNPTPCFCMHRVVYGFRSHRRCHTSGFASASTYATRCFLLDTRLHLHQRRHRGFLRLTYVLRLTCIFESPYDVRSSVTISSSCERIHSHRW